MESDVRYGVSSQTYDQCAVVTEADKGCGIVNQDLLRCRWSGDGHYRNLSGNILCGLRSFVFVDR